jgi:hypothetical protein
MAGNISYPGLSDALDANYRTYSSAQLEASSGTVTVPNKVLIGSSYIFVSNQTFVNGGLLRVVVNELMQHFDIISTSSNDSSLINWFLVYPTTNTPGLPSLSTPAGLSILDRTAGFTTFGKAKLTGGTVTVNTAYANFGQKIFLLCGSLNSTNAGVYSIGTVIPGVSFVINSSNGSDDAYVWYYMIISTNAGFTPGHPVGTLQLCFDSGSATIGVTQLVNGFATVNTTRADNSVENASVFIANIRTPATNLVNQGIVTIPHEQVVASQSFQIISTNNNDDSVIQWMMLNSTTHTHG